MAIANYCCQNGERKMEQRRSNTAITLVLQTQILYKLHTENPAPLKDLIAKLKKVTISNKTLLKIQNTLCSIYCFPTAHYHKQLHNNV